MVITPRVCGWREGGNKRRQEIRDSVQKEEGGKMKVD